MIVVPVNTPVIIPDEEPMEATAGFELVHTPPETLLAKGALDAIQKIVPPVMEPGRG
jgi:hypothetical protein